MSCLGCCDTCCCCLCSNGECAPCRRCSPMVISQGAQDNAQSCTSGTLSTINSLIMAGGQIGGKIIQGNQKNQALAVKAKAAQTAAKSQSTMMIVIVVIIVIGVFLFAGGKNG